MQDVPYEDDKDNEKESKQEIGDGDAVVRKKKPEETKEQKAARIEQENAKEKEFVNLISKINIIISDNNYYYMIISCTPLFYANLFCRNLFLQVLG